MMPQNHDTLATSNDARNGPMGVSDSPVHNALPLTDEISGTGEQSVPYSIYTAREKWIIVFLIAFGGLFSPLSANIYFPVIPTIALAFRKTTELINLTVTTYIIFQGLAPMFWGTLADSFGRRPMFIACLILLAVSCVGLALVPTNAYWLLMVLRCVQAAGSASTIALGAGVIGDISEPAERGGFFGLYNIGPMAGPSLGPVIGGLLAGSLGWRSIFWFLVITSSGCALVLLLLLPETLRSIVGNGSIPPSNPLFSRPVLPLLGSSKSRLDSAGKALSRKPFENPLRILSNLDILFLLLFTGIICAVFYGVTASISTIFKETYTDLTETQLGLCYLSIGGGMLIGSVTAGRLLDWDYRRVQNAELGDVEKLSRDMDSFPVEKARMRLMPALLCDSDVSGLPKWLGPAPSGFFWLVMGFGL
ncbi:unnamed protein product [Mycena citricolor]|uniref:Major facilitator superfamily (MFS) profile domain-containing protein n=1 Tax=Mycena citricolor TaxID=2018698 RepID=A0AAD2HMZ4_9AGAR|nr:unnamed protein product [Mycena citricolor]